MTTWTAEYVSDGFFTNCGCSKSLQTLQIIQSLITECTRRKLKMVTQLKRLFALAASVLLALTSASQDRILTLKRSYECLQRKSAPRQGFRGHFTKNLNEFRRLLCNTSRLYNIYTQERRDGIIKNESNKITSFNRNF